MKGMHPMGRAMLRKKVLNATVPGEAVDVDEEEQLNAQSEAVDDLLKKKEPEPPKDYKELKVGDIVELSGVPMRVRKLTKKDVVLRPVKKAIRDEHGLMLSEKEEKRIIESEPSAKGG